MRKESCSFPKKCPDTTVKCIECDYMKRYVRADVAERYARMREVRAYDIGYTEGLNNCGELTEAQQAAQRDGGEKKV